MLYLVTTSTEILAFDLLRLQMWAKQMTSAPEQKDVKVFCA